MNLKKLAGRNNKDSISSMPSTYSSPMLLSPFQNIYESEKSTLPPSGREKGLLITGLNENGYTSSPSSSSVSPDWSPEPVSPEALKIDSKAKDLYRCAYSPNSPYDTAKLATDDRSDNEAVSTRSTGVTLRSVSNYSNLPYAPQLDVEDPSQEVSRHPMYPQPLLVSPALRPYANCNMPLMCVYDLDDNNDLSAPFSLSASNLITGDRQFQMQFHDKQEHAVNTNTEQATVLSSNQSLRQQSQIVHRNELLPDSTDEFQKKNSGACLTRKTGANGNIPMSSENATSDHTNLSKTKSRRRSRNMMGQFSSVFTKTKQQESIVLAQTDEQDPDLNVIYPPVCLDSDFYVFRSSIYSPCYNALTPHRP